LFDPKGVLDDTKASKREKCWADYKAQLLYIDAMREAKEDPEFDPRRTHLVVGKDGRFEKISQSAVVIPKNPLTVYNTCVTHMTSLIRHLRGGNKMPS
jgi:hypothetical protein